MILAIALAPGVGAAHAQGAPGFDDVNRSFSGGGGGGGNPLSGWANDLQAKMNYTSTVLTPAIPSAAAILGAVISRGLFASAYPRIGPVGTLAALALGGGVVSAGVQYAMKGKVDLKDTLVDGAVGIVGGGLLRSGGGFGTALGPAAALVGGTAAKMNIPRR